MEQDNPDNWRKSIYYHFYEYPGFHSVNRHYGIRTDRYKLIHFYYNIDEWEFFDLSEDPAETNNLINSEAHREIIENLKTELQHLMTRYQEPPMNSWLHKDIYEGRRMFKVPESNLTYETVLE